MSNIIAKAPARISLFGGGSDVSPYVDLYGGEVISFAINLYSHVTLLTNEDQWSQTSHSFPAGSDPALFYTILDRYHLNGMHSDIRVRSRFDGVIGAGLASSASATIALLGGIYRHQRLPMTEMALAKKGWELEKTFHSTGQQDHYAAVFGGMNTFLFHADRVRRFPYPRAIAKAFEKHIVLCYIGGARKDKDGQKPLATLTQKRKEDLDWMKKIAYQAETVILEQHWQKLGMLLAESWELKKSVNAGITDSRIDAIYDGALKHGALGGKLCGSGQGGYMIFLVRPEKQDYFTTTMQKLYHIERVDYEIDFTGLSTRIL